MVSLLPRRKQQSFIIERFGSAHAQVASPPVPPPAAGPAVARAVAKSRGSQSGLTREAVEGVEDPESGAPLGDLAFKRDGPSRRVRGPTQPGVEMARADRRDEALSFAEGMLGEAQYRTAYARFHKFATDTKSQANGPDIVLRGIGADILGLLQTGSRSRGDLLSLRWSCSCLQRGWRYRWVWPCSSTSAVLA